jgi:hypothetical protein
LTNLKNLSKYCWSKKSIWSEENLTEAHTKWEQSSRHRPAEQFLESINKYIYLRSL